LELGTLSEKGTKNLVREKLRAETNRSVIGFVYPHAFDSVYQFSRVAFINTSETEQFQKGTISARTGSGEQIPSLHLEDYFFATLGSEPGKPMHMTTSRHEEIAYPFPNNLRRRGITGAVPLFVATVIIMEGDWNTGHKHVAKLNRKLQSFFERKSRNTESQPDN
jgi:hypothetical protein